MYQREFTVKVTDEGMQHVCKDVTKYEKKLCVLGYGGVVLAVLEMFAHAL